MPPEAMPPKAMPPKAIPPKRKDSLDSDYSGPDEEALATARSKLNIDTIERIQAAIKSNPRVNLLSIIPRYREAWILGDETAIPLPIIEPTSWPQGPVNFCADLVAHAHAATIIHPLSDAAISSLTAHLEPDSPTLDSTQWLLPALKHMISHSEKLWEQPARGVVLRCGDNLIAKIIPGNNDYTEYTSLQYLHEHAPELPVPKPHGLVRFDNVRVIFMTYIPSVTLQKVWSSLAHNNKILIQNQLDQVFSKLRLLKYNRHCLGGVSGEGVKLDHQLYRKEVITTAADFENLGFSVPHRATTSWVNYLRSFLPAPKDAFVFTHGDFHTGNIMVTLEENGNYGLSGIIDWEDSGFYPEYYECCRLLDTFGPGSDDDLCAYIPPSISPTKHIRRWLVSRLWAHTIRF